MRRGLIVFGVLACAAGHGVAWAQCASGSSSCQWRDQAYDYTSGASETYKVRGQDYSFIRNPGVTSNTLNSNIINQQRTRLRLHSSTENTNGLQMWLDASRGGITLPVSSVLSKLTSAASGAGALSADSINGLAAWQFNAGTWIKPSPALGGMRQFSVYLVGSGVTGPANILALSSTTPANRWSIRATTTTSFLATIGGVSSNSLGILTNQPFVASLRYDGNSGKFVVNGNPATVSYSSLGSANTDVLVIGPQSPSTGALDLGELRIFSRSLSDQEHTALMKRLCQKWGVASCS